MLSKQVKIKPEEIKSGWSPESADFINNLLMRKAEERLGTKKGASELKAHSWLKYYPWSELQDKKLPAPFIPEKKDNFDKHYCESIDKIGETTKMRYEEILFKDTFKNAFVEFYFDKEEEEKKKKLEEEKKKKIEEEKKKKLDEEKKKKIEEEKKQENKKKNISINSPMNLINKENIILNIPNSHNIKSNNDLLNSTNIKNINNNNNNNKNRPSSTNKYRKINNNKNNILNMKNKINNNKNNNINFQENLLKHSNSQKHVIDIKKIEKNSSKNNNIA
jgi:hypothetical protein